MAYLDVHQQDALIRRDFPDFRLTAEAGWSACGKDRSGRYRALTAFASFIFAGSFLTVGIWKTLTFPSRSLIH